MHVKYTNMYVARTLSFAKCKFDMIDVKIPDTLKLQYNCVCQLLQRMIAGSVLEKQDRDKTFASKFWSSCQRIFAQLIFAAKVDATRQIAQQALLEGKCVVIGLGDIPADHPSCPPNRTHAH